MDVGVIVVILVVGSFGVASAVLGFIAERTKLTSYDIDIDRYTEECVYPANPAYLLSIIAIPLLAVAMIIASLTGGCCGCCRPRHGASESKRIIGIVAAVFSWIAALLAGGFYANGAVWNFPITRYGFDTWCRLVGDGYLRLPALLSLAATALAILSYIMLRARAPDARPPSTAPEAGPSEPKQPPPLGEAELVPPEPAQVPSSHGHRQAQQPPLPEHRVAAGPSWTPPYRQVATPPRRQAQPAVEIMMA